MHTRPVAPRDYPAITDILNHEIASGVAHFGTEPQTLEQTREQFDKLGTRYPAYAAQLDDHPDARTIGFCKSGPWNPRGAYAWSVEITVYVDHAHHRQGVGRALYAALVPDLRARGFRTMLAGVTLPNPASVALHESLGMRRAALFPDVGYKHGKWRSVAYWTMDLNPVAQDRALPQPC
ncbi:MAG: N-acetyltransferase family protein [Phycisphaerales bacterium]